jgi:hypothetical protein
MLLEQRLVPRGGATFLQGWYEANQPTANQPHETRKRCLLHKPHKDMESI